MIRLLALDIDDTLLDSRGRLPAENKAAIARAADAGVTVTISTGRAYAGAKAICEAIGLPEIPVITFGGAQIADYPSGKTLFMDLLPAETVREVCAFAWERGEYVQIYDGDDYLFHKDGEEARYYAGRLGYPGIQVDLLAGDFHNSPKVLTILSEETIADFYRAAREHFGDRLRIFQSGPRFIEFCNPGIDKGSALAQLGRMLGIAREEMLAIGDNGIDVPMLRYAGLGIAVANATEECKEAADLITLSCDDNAVAHVIDTIILPQNPIRS